MERLVIRMVIGLYTLVLAAKFDNDIKIFDTNVIIIVPAVAKIT
jgi:hypothetical protein